MMAGMLWTPDLHGPPRFRPSERILTLETGERVRVTIESDGRGSVTHVEHDHSLDAIVRPSTITVKVRPHAIGR